VPATIEDQLDLERTMQDKGVERYKSAQRKAEQEGRGSDLAYSRRWLQEFIGPSIDALQDSLDKSGFRYNGTARRLLKRVPADRAMFIAMKAMFNGFTLNDRIVTVAGRIGQHVEDEIRFSRFQEMHKDYYDKIIADFKRKGTKDYRFMHRVLTHTANKMNDGWNTWKPAERVQVGTMLLNIILETTDLAKKVVRRVRNKHDSYLVPTESAKKWINDHEEISQFLWPDKMPCIIQPDDWTGLYQGGYYSPGLRQTTPMVKTSGNLQKKLLEAGDLSLVSETLNSLQAVSWRVNLNVLNIVRQVWRQNLGTGMVQSEPFTPSPNPLGNIKKADMNEQQIAIFIDWKREAAEVYTLEKERVAQSFQFSRVLSMADAYESRASFWFVWYADFRGRLYTATAGFSPQGPDVAKGLLEFSTPLPLGADGLYWLKVHGANRYGFDKTNYNARVSWVDEREDEFRKAARDPLRFRELWGAADKPWQFLAFLFEFEAVCSLRDRGEDTTRFNSHIRVGLDGSCNGLQNFSAMLRDERGGRATNLVPGELPSDIYAEVAGVCYTKILALQATDGLASRWLAFCDKYGEGTIPRSLAKRPVMTLPYGATRNSCTKYIFKSILEIDKNFFADGNFRAAIWLTDHMWSAIGEVVGAAHEVMTWLQSAASVLGKENLPLVWTTADGFVVVQASRHIKTKQIETQLDGRFRLTVGEYSDKLNVMKQRQGISPNFVHSQDATHLRSTVREAARQGITSIDVIHDDFGTHAGNTDKLHDIIRDTFVGLYASGCPLTAFKHEQPIPLIDIPKKGSLDIQQVRESLYFFG
jgi:DNA-directed RNA polymerase